MSNLPTDTQTEIPATLDQKSALQIFTEYFARNYPGPDTVIYDPHWHAPKIFAAAKHAIMADRAARVSDLEAKLAEGWLPIETAPKDGTRVIIAVPTKEHDDFIVGEAYFDPYHYNDGDWWWAGNSHCDYHGGPISEINHNGPTHWQLLPSAPQPAIRKDEG